MPARSWFLALIMLVLTSLVPLRTQAAPTTLRLTWEPGQPTLIPIRLTGDPDLLITTIQTHQATAHAHPDAVLPRAAAWIERTAMLRGVRYAVVAIAPTFIHHGRTVDLTHLDLTVDDAQPIAAPPAISSRDLPFGAPLPPTNPLTTRSGVIARATQPGIQEIRAADLAAQGLTLPLVSAALHAWVDGEELALDVRDGGDGWLDASDTVRCWLPTVGDRWNRDTLIWLSLDAVRLPRRMAVRPALVGGSAPLATTALGVAVWRDPRVYESRIAGPNGDHWASRQLRVVAGGAAATATIPLTVPFALATAPMTVTIRGMTMQAGAHQLRVTAGDATTSAAWAGSGAWTQTVVLPTFAPTLTLTLPSAAGDDLLVDTLVATGTMRLNDLQATSATWHGVADRARYALGNLPPGRTLYDVTDTANPTAISLPAGRNVVIEEDGGRQYALLADGDAQLPALEAYTPLPLPSTGTALVIAPQAFLEALGPLAEVRATQGTPLMLVAVEALYARWGWGRTDPQAIRSFLRNAAATWPAPPTSVLLVGDGTSDPQDYLGFGNPTLIPPYLAMVDPWIGETSCDHCYVQLDGDSPLDDALPDLAIGRLPVRTAAEVERLVAKLIAYDRLPYGAWQGRVVSVADNTRNQAGVPETVNDFAGLAAASEAWYPAGINTERIFYDPDPATANQPGHEPNAQIAYARTVAAIARGAAVVQYLGHGSSWQWAYTAASSIPSYLFGITEAETLQSAAGLPVVLEMTCATSTIQQPSVRGSTIDEALVLNPSGAIATWGSSGLGVAYGHQYLHEGFVRALSAGDRSLGGLTSAGIWTLWSEGQCCVDAIRTYHLLGDPLTAVQLHIGKQVMLPFVGR